jgi:hypothetical protein
MTKPPLALPAAWLACALGACSSGQLNQVPVETRCAAGDKGCETAGAIRPLAVGARMPLEVNAIAAPGGQIPATHLAIVDEDVAVDDRGQLLGVGAGVTAVLFVTDDDSVLDLTHVAIARAERLAFVSGDQAEVAGPITMAPGGVVALSLAAKSDSQTLGGDLGEAFVIDNAAFTLTASPGAVAIRAPTDVTQPERAILEARALDLVTFLEVEVLP